MVVKNKGMRHLIFFAGILSLISLPVFAGEYDDAEEGMTSQKGKHHRWFQRIDKDDDGKISEDEFEKAAEDKFGHLDENGDEIVTQEEWRSAAEKWRKKHRQGHYQHYRGENGGNWGHSMEDRGEM